MRGIPHTLIHPALTRRDGDAWLAPQPIQGDADLLGIARAHAIGNDVHLVAGVAQVKGRLGDADVRLDADEGDLRRRGGEGGGDGGDEHGEEGLVVVRGGGEEGREGGDGWAELGGGLGGGDDGDGEGVGEGEEFLGCGYAGV